MARRALLLCGLLCMLCIGACARADEPQAPAVRATASSEPAQAPAVEPAPPEQPPPEQPPPGPPPPVVGQAPAADELLLLRRGTCHAHTSRIEGCEPMWRGLVRTPTEPQFVTCELDLEDIDEAGLKSRELIRGRIDVVALDDESHRRRCDIVEVEAKLAAHEHGIQPLDAYSIGPADLGVTPAAQQLDVQELERGPMRVLLGVDSGRVLVASVYLNDLGPLLAIPGRPLITNEMLRAEFDEALQRGDRVDWVGGAKSFAPQVADAGERMSYAYTPVLSAGASEGELHETHPWYHANAVPLRGDDGRRYLLMSFGMMKSSWESAKRRGQMIIRITEDGLHPDESAAK